MSVTQWLGEVYGGKWTHPRFSADWLCDDGLRSMARGTSCDCDYAGGHGSEYFMYTPEGAKRVTPWSSLFWQVVSTCKHEWSDSYGASGPCANVVCQWTERRCKLCHVYNVRCPCGFETGFNGWPRNRSSRARLIKRLREMGGSV